MLQTCGVASGSGKSGLTWALWGVLCATMTTALSAAEPSGSARRIQLMGDGWVAQRAGGIALMADAAVAFPPGVGPQLRIAAARSPEVAVHGMVPFISPTITADLLPWTPQVVVLSFSGEDPVPTKAFDRKRFDLYVGPALAEAIHRISATGAKVLVATPPPLEAHPQAGMEIADTALAACSAALSETATKAGAEVLDLNMRLRVLREQAGPAAPPLHDINAAKNEIVLSASGQVVVAALVAEGCGGLPLPASLVVDAAGMVRDAQRCTVTGLTVEAGKILSFTRTDAALPAPGANDAAAFRDFLPALDRMYRYPFTVTGLAAGSWHLQVAGVEVGNFTAIELAAGVDLSTRPGPWQALAQEARHAAAAQDQAYELRCGTVTRLCVPASAEPSRARLVAACDRMVECLEGRRRGLPASTRAWTWTLEAR